MKLRASLRARLTLSALVGAAAMLAVLVTAFNLVLDARLRADRDNVLSERAAAVLRDLGTVNGRLSVLEAPDQGAVDTQTWIFAGERALEQPAGIDPRIQAAARALVGAGRSFRTVDAASTRLAAIPVTQGGRRLGTVVIAASLAPYRSTARSALLGSVALGLLILAAVVALSRWLVGHALRPVARMTAEAADWSGHDLSRRFYAGKPHDELTRLAFVLDGLLARLGQSLRREQSLTAEISHELRTPLAKILAETELASTGARSASAARAPRETLAVTAGHAEHLQRVLETVLASARAALPGQSAVSDAPEMTLRAFESVRERATARGVELELRGSGPVRAAIAGDLLERIVAPLLENAARYARARITVAIRTADGSVLIEVGDDGPGVDPSERELIFDPGFRSAADAAAAGGHRGRGSRARARPPPGALGRGRGRGASPPPAPASSCVSPRPERPPIASSQPGGGRGRPGPRASGPDRSRE
jgi:two-component system heavy metal sensor histidine kinase CusS